MPVGALTVRCIRRGGLLPQMEGPTHRYMESSPGCWYAHGEVLSREYSDQAFRPAHRLTVDSYAVPHPGRPTHGRLGLNTLRRSADGCPRRKNETAGPILRAGGSDVARLRGNERRGGRAQKRKPTAMRNSRGNG